MTQSITDIIYNILSRHHELTAGAIFKKCADIKSIGNQKTVSNALIRLKKEGRVESVYDKDKGLWLWHIVRESPVASIDCAMRIGDAAAMANKPGTADHFSHAEDMASDVAEIEQPTVQESLTAAITTSNVVNHDAECRARPRKPYTPNKIAGAYAYRGALVIKLDRKANAKSITLSAKDMAMLTSIFGGTA